MTTQNTNNNESKKTWEDIIKEYFDSSNLKWVDFLKQKEKDGVVCINPPSKEEIYKITFDVMDKYIVYIDKMLCEEISKVIFKRNKEGK